MRRVGDGTKRGPHDRPWLSQRPRLLVRARQAAGCPSTAELVTPDRARAISARAAGLNGPPVRQASARRPRMAGRVTSIACSSGWTRATDSGRMAIPSPRLASAARRSSRPRRSASRSWGRPSPSADRRSGAARMIRGTRLLYGSLTERSSRPVAHLSVERPATERSCHGPGVTFADRTVEPLRAAGAARRRSPAMSRLDALLRARGWRGGRGEHRRPRRRTPAERTSRNWGGSSHGSHPGRRRRTVNPPIPSVTRLAPASAAVSRASANP